MTKEGSQYVPIPASTVHLSPGFLKFFARAAGAQRRALSGRCTTPPHFGYSLKQVNSNVDGLEVKIGSEALSGTGPAKPLVWTGAENVLTTEKGSAVLGTYNGPWAVFRFVSDARISGAGSTLELLWVQRNNNTDIILPNGKLKSYTYELQVNGLNPFRASRMGEHALRASDQCSKKIAGR